MLDLERDELGAAERAGEADEDHGAIPFGARSSAEGARHRPKIAGQHGRGAFFADTGGAANAALDEPRAWIGVGPWRPAQPRAWAMPRRAPNGGGLATELRQGSKVAAEGLRRGGQRGEVMLSTPPFEALPVGAVGASSVVRVRVIGVLIQGVVELDQGQAGRDGVAGGGLGRRGRSVEIFEESELGGHRDHASERQFSQIDER